MNLAEFGIWAISQGSVANPQENSFKGQCVSLIQQYLYQVFGKPFKAHGNAKDWATNYPKDYFTKVSTSTKLQKSYTNLTTNAKANAYNSGANAGCLKSGTKVTVQEIKNIGNDVWIKIPSGWISGYYNGKTYVK